jgi:Ca2+-binding RTX toxin-like protein
MEAQMADAWLYPNTQSGSWPVVDMGTDYNVYIDAGVYISTTGASGSTILGTGTEQQVLVEGHLAGDHVIDLRGGYANDVGDSVVIEKGGKLFAGSTAIEMEGFNNTIENHGVIQSIHTGVYISGTSLTGVSHILNTGLIEAGSDAVYAFGGTQKIILNNTGVISGDLTSYQGSHGVDVVRNSGTMTGRVDLAEGNDFYDGRHGILLGQGGGVVWGHDGNDKIYGGAKAELLQGDNGNDVIAGGGGADTLFGGTDADRFVFFLASDSTTKASGRDTITDFEHGLDSIDLSKLHPDTANDRFKFVGENALKHAGDLHFVQHDAAGTANDYTMVAGDLDGKSGADFSIKLLGLIDLGRSDFIL